MDEEYVFVGGGYIMGGEGLIVGEKYVVCEMHRGMACVTDLDGSLGYSVALTKAEEKYFEKC